MCVAVHCREDKHSLIHEQHSKHVEYRIRVVHEMEDPFVAFRGFDRLPATPCLLLHTPCIQR
jgi:hypothetical protein